MLTRTFFIASLLICGLITSAQKSAKLETKTISSSFNYYGTLFSTDAQSGKLNPLSDTAKTAVYTGALWLWGLDSANNSVTAVQTFPHQTTGAPKTDFSAGPVATNYVDSARKAKYERLWKLSLDEINTHKNNYNTPGYTAPLEILEWPAHGDTSNGESWRLAPFADLNGNELYEPQAGEYPVIRGDEAIYMIFNDAYRPNYQSPSTLKMEVHLMAYIYDDSTQAMQNTVFLAYRIINRSGKDLTHFKAALFLDYDLGNGLNDLGGSDSLTNLAYVYNASNRDDGANGFGLNPPAAGAKSLGGQAAGALFYENNSQFTGNPSTAMEYANLIQLKWKNGLPLVLENPSGLGATQNGDGYAPGGTPTTSWHYNESENWYANPNNFKDIRSLLSMPTRQFNADEQLCYDFAVSFAHDSSNHSSFKPYRSVIALKNQMNSVQQFYDARHFTCLDETVATEQLPLKPVKIYPNPARRSLTIAGDFEIEEIKLYSLSGRQVLAKNLQANRRVKLELPPHLAKGVYLLHITGPRQAVMVEKVMIE